MRRKIWPWDEEPVFLMSGDDDGDDDGGDDDGGGGGGGDSSGGGGTGGDSGGGTGGDSSGGTGGEGTGGTGGDSGGAGSDAGSAGDAGTGDTGSTTSTTDNGEGSGQTTISGGDTGGGGDATGGDPTGGDQSPGGGVTGEPGGGGTGDAPAGADPTGGDQSPGAQGSLSGTPAADASGEQGISLGLDAANALNTASSASPSATAAAAGLPGGVSSPSDILAGVSPVSQALDEAPPNPFGNPVQDNINPTIDPSLQPVPLTDPQRFMDPNFTPPNQQPDTTPPPGFNTGQTNIGQAPAASPSLASMLGVSPANAADLSTQPNFYSELQTAPPGFSITNPAPMSVDQMMANTFGTNTPPGTVAPNDVSTIMATGMPGSVPNAPVSTTAGLNGVPAATVDLTSGNPIVGNPNDPNTNKSDMADMTAAARIANASGAGMFDSQPSDLQATKVATFDNGPQSGQTTVTGKVADNGPGPAPDTQPGSQPNAPGANTGPEAAAALANPNSNTLASAGSSTQLGDPQLLASQLTAPIPPDGGGSPTAPAADGTAPFVPFIPTPMIVDPNLNPEEGFWGPAAHPGGPVPPEQFQFDGGVPGGPTLGPIMDPNGTGGPILGPIMDRNGLLSETGADALNNATG